VACDPLIDWRGVRLVAFDVDGTLYSQSKLRARIVPELLLASALNFDLRAMRIIRAYRDARERLADQEREAFDPVLLAEVARNCGANEALVEAVTDEWLQRRPLRLLAACRYDGVAQFFDLVRRSGRRIAILSDYPAHEKLKAMHLAADVVVWAGEPEVAIMKPHPRGLEVLLARSGVAAQEAILIGDRPERDGAAGRRAGVRTYIRSAKPREGWPSFASYRDLVAQGVPELA
jgi:putative hydrolase of the HAD superfamily